MIITLFLIWVLGFAVLAVIFRTASIGEPTLHGKETLGLIGCAVAVFWPFLLAYFALFGCIFGPYYGYCWVREALTAWRKKRGESGND